MRFYFDTEFNGFHKGPYGGALISAAIVREDGESLYLIDPDYDVSPHLATEEQRSSIDPWVLHNVIPLLYDVPDHIEPRDVPVADWGALLGAFIYDDPDQRPQVFADWPSDIMEFCNLLMTGPGVAVPMLHQTHFTVLRHLDVYPTTLPGAVQHNAWWDAMALRHWVRQTEGVD